MVTMTISRDINVVRCSFFSFLNLKFLKLKQEKNLFENQLIEIYLTKRHLSQSSSTGYIVHHHKHRNCIAVLQQERTCLFELQIFIQLFSFSFFFKYFTCRTKKPFPLSDFTFDFFFD